MPRTTFIRSCTSHPDLSEAAIDTLIEHVAGTRSLSPYTAIHIHHVGGAVKRVGSDETAFSHRDPRYVLNIVAFWTANEAADPHTAWARRCWEAMRLFSAGDPYLNFLGDEGGDRVRAAYGEKTYQRLVALKDKYDPTNFFRVNQNIKPTAAAKV